MKVSVITVVFNAHNTIANAIDSILRQSHSNIELIIIDGGSTDGTLELISKYESLISVLVSEPDKGIYHAMNKGIASASGDVIGFLNADDFYPSVNVISSIVNLFSQRDISACYGDLQYVDNMDHQMVRRNWKSGPYDYRNFYWGWMPPHPTFFVRKAVYEKYGGFNLDMGSAADYELMLRFLLKHRINVLYIPEVLVKMRTGGISNSSFSNRLKANIMDRKAWRINGLIPYPWTLILKPLRKIGQWL